MTIKLILAAANRFVPATRTSSMTFFATTPARMALSLYGCIWCSVAAAQDSPGIDLYGSLRSQLETVSPDHDRAYTGMRDAYSRVGINARYPVDANLALTAQLELPVDVANTRLRDPYDQDEPIRLATIGVQGKFGAITYGQQWMPFYNAVAAPVDMFSSYYSGYATYTVFRVAKTLAYSTPDYQGLSFGAAYSGSSGNRRSTSRIDDRRWQAAATYTRGDTRLAAGIDDRGDAGYGRNRLYGIALSHQVDDLYLAIKYEAFESGNRQADSFSTNGNRAVNFYGHYVMGKSTVKLMLAKVDNYGDEIVHVGIDHALSSQSRVFAEVYHEAATAALTARRGGLDDGGAIVHGGRAIAVGLRHDF
ncbi:porin [Massilia aurea]|uniref:porin n=1 Tax=Massilia aurea TaxID=373040 RepID=UPI0034635917